MPKSTTSTPAGSARRPSRSASATPKPSSPRKTLPIPATRIRGRRDGGRPSSALERLDLVGREEEAVPGLAAHRRGRGPGRRRSRPRAAGCPPCPARCPRPTAVRPASARSNTSPPLAGPQPHAAAARAARRRRPRPCPGRGARAPPSSSGRRSPQHLPVPDGAVQAHDLLRRERLGALEDLRARAGPTRASRPSPRRSG